MSDTTFLFLCLSSLGMMLSRARPCSCEWHYSILSNGWVQPVVYTHHALKKSFITVAVQPASSRPGLPTVVRYCGTRCLVVSALAAPLPHSSSSPRYTHGSLLPSLRSALKTSIWRNLYGKCYPSGTLFCFPVCYSSEHHWNTSRFCSPPVSRVPGAPGQHSPGQVVNVQLRAGRACCTGAPWG